MCVSKSMVFGLASLVCTIKATQVMGNVLAKRGSTIKSTVIMTGTPPSTSTAGSDDDYGIAVCLIADEGDWDCQFNFPTVPLSSVSATLTSPLPTSDAHTVASVKQREQVSGTFGDCTALCWDLMPGTECDVQCSSDYKTKIPVPSKVARVANLKARENLQVQQVREARLARKFGANVARDDKFIGRRTPHQLLPRTTAALPTVEVFTSWVPPPDTRASYFSAMLAGFASVSAKHAASSEAASLSSATLQLSSAVLSSTSASVATPLPNFVNKTVAAPASTGSAPTVKATRTSILSTAISSANKTALSISSKTTTASTTTTTALNVSFVGAPTATHFIATTYEGDAAQQYTGSTGLVLSLLVGLAANIAFLI